jgi:hypothetical protein
MGRDYPDNEEKKDNARTDIDRPNGRESSSAL